LWENVSALMRRDYGVENLSRLVRETAIGPGSATRIKEQETSVGIDVLEKLAGHFKVEPWQLLAPALGASEPDKRWPELSPLARDSAQPCLGSQPEMRIKDEPSVYGQRLKWALDQRPGAGVTELANATRVSYQAIRAVLKGGEGETKALSSETHVRAARFLGVDSFWLATGEGSPREPTDRKWSELSPLARAAALLLDRLRDDEAQQEVIYAELALRLLPELRSPSASDARATPATEPTRKRERHP
jgi:hypothetical protein